MDDVDHRAVRQENASGAATDSVRSMPDGVRFVVPAPEPLRQAWSDLQESIVRQESGPDDDAVRRSLELGYELVTNEALQQASTACQAMVYRAYAHVALEAARTSALLQHSEIALAAMHEAIRRQPVGSVEEALLRLECSQMLILYGQLSGDLDEVRRATAMAEACIIAVPEDDPDYPEALSNVASALGARFEITGALADLDLQIVVMKRALELAGDHVLVRLQYLYQLGCEYATRYERSGEQADNEESIRLLEEALTLTTPGYARHVQNVLATDLKARLMYAPTTEDANRILRLYQDILANTSPSSIDYSGYLNNYGRYCLQLYRWMREPNSLDEAIGALREAVRRCPAGSPDRPGYQGNLAAALGEAARRSPSDAERAAEATKAYRAAADAAVSVSAEIELDVCRGWGGYAQDMRDWPASSEAFGRAVTVLRRLLSRQGERRHKEIWLRETQGLAAAWAWTEVKRGDPRGAVLAMESAQAVLLREALSDDGSGPDVRHVDSGVLERTPPGHTVLYLAAARDGGTAVVVRDGDVVARELPGLSVEALTTMTEAVRLDEADTVTEFDARLDRLVGWLSENAVDPVADLLAGPLSIVPIGPLAALPLHLAGSRAPLLGLGAVGFLPSLAALTVGGPLPPTVNLLGIADPEPTSQAPLTGALCELECISARFHGTFLRREEARLDAVRAALPVADVVHLATHAWADVAAPMNSAVLLAEDEFLTLAEVLAMRTTARLVVLSACESAVPGSPLPDEIVSLPTGFLQAGADGVIGSLWPVEDTPTTVLMAEVWRWLAHAEAPIDALCGTQRWLGAIGPGELVAWAADPMFPDSLRSLVREWIDEHPRWERPFGLRRWWGAFTFTGA